MRVRWQGTIHVSPPVEKVYAYLADFSKHPEWAGTVTRLECTKPGDERGIGAQYIAYEHVDFVPEGWCRRLPRAKEARSFSEVIELVPSQRIAWNAHPIPNVGSASLSFELAPAAGGGTSITQTLDERYSPPVALFLRVAYNLTEGSIRKTLDEGLDNLRRVIESRQW